MPDGSDGFRDIIAQELNVISTSLKNELSSFWECKNYDVKKLRFNNKNVNICTKLGKIL